MEFSDVIRKRYSVRSYQPREVESDKLERVLQAAVLAPTACNRQPFTLIVIHTKGRENELARVYPRPWFATAPIVIAACGMPAANWVRSDGKNYNDVDVTIVMDHLILAAANEGLGTCWIGAFNPAAAREVLRIPDDVEPIAFTPVGYAADSPMQKVRKPVERLVRYERW